MTVNSTYLLSIVEKNAITAVSKAKQLDIAPRYLTSGGLPGQCIWEV